MNEKRLQVLFIASWYPNKVRPLLGIFVKRHAVAIAKICDVSALFVYASNEDKLEEATEDGVFTMRLSYKRWVSKLRVLSLVVNAARYFSAWRRLLETYKQKKGIPDVVNLDVIMPASRIVRYIKKEWKVPYVISEHWTGYFPEDGRYKGLGMKSLTMKAVNYASAIITVSNDLKNQMISHGLKNEYFVVSNVVDTTIFNIPEIRKKGEIIRFIHVSALDDMQKNVSGIIKVFGKVYETFENTEMIICGDGGEADALVRLSKSLGLEGAVHFVGKKLDSELVELLQSSDAFVLFSNYETQAVVLLESICCGTPVIATRTGGVAEYVNDKNGILIEPKNEKQLYDAMVTIIKERGKFGAPGNIRATVVDMVNADTIAKQYLEVYKKVLNKN